MGETKMLKIEKAEIEDAKTILDIYNDSNKVFKVVPEQDIIETFENMIKTENTYILYEDNRAIGFISLKDKNTHGLISAIYIKHKIQRKGYGKYILNFIEQEAKHIGLEYLILKALKMFEWTIEFYKKNGFTIFDKKEDELPFITEYIPPAKWEVVMIKRIITCK